MTRKSNRDHNQNQPIPPAKTGQLNRLANQTTFPAECAKTVIEIADRSASNIRFVAGVFDPPSELPSDYHFNIDAFSKENLGRVTEFMTAKGRRQLWDFYDPEDLANEALQRVDDYVRKHPDSSRDEVLIKKVLWDIVNCIWIREVRRELQEGNLSGSGSICESSLGEFVDQIADRRFGSEVSMQELLDDIKPQMSLRQNKIVRLLLEKQSLHDISSAIGVCESTIDKETAIIKKVLGPRLGTTSIEHRASSNEQRTTNNEQRTTRLQPALKKLFPFF